MADDECDPDYKHADFAYYRFEPSVAVNALFLALFVLSTLLHGLQLWKSRTWYLSALVLGGCCMCSLRQVDSLADFSRKARLSDTQADSLTRGRTLAAGASARMSCKTC